MTQTVQADLRTLSSRTSLRSNPTLAKQAFHAVWHLRIPLGLALLALLMGHSATPLHAQVLYGTLVGNVSDSLGHPILGATLVATNTGTSIAKTATTDNTGNYRFSNIEPGTYSLSVAAATFGKEVMQGLEVRANSELRVDSQLRPKSVGETVTVTGAPPELQTDTAEVASDLEAVQVQTLDTTAGNNMRNFQSLYMVIPGFTPPASTHSESGNPADTMFVNVNGLSGSNNNTRIDGVSDVYAWLPEITAYTPATDAIASVNVVTNSYNAEQGFASGAAVNVTTKSGTNKFYGAAWEYNTDSALFAKGFFVPTTQAIPKYILNQFGANYGGPIKKNKAFFFGNWERTRRAQAVYSTSLSVPTAKMLAGDLSENIDSSGNLIPIYDPSTGNPDGTGRTAFVGNIIPAARLATPAAYAAQQMIKLLAGDTPNQTVKAGTVANNFYSAASAEYTRDNVDSRVDFNPTGKSTLFGRYGVQKTNLYDPQGLHAAGGNTLDGGQPGNAPSIVQSVGIGTTYMFKTNLLLDANIGYLRQGMAAKNTDLGTDWGETYFDIPGTNGACTLCGGMPQFNFNTLSALGNPNRSNPFQFRDTTYVSAANMSWIKGKHSVRFGGEFMRFDINHFQPQNTYGPRGGFNFSGGLTASAGPATSNPAAAKTSPTAYNSWADFLLGLPNQIQKDTQYLNPATSRENVWAAYVEDQWQATGKLTVNYGVRYEYYPISTRDHTGLDIFDPIDGLIKVGGVNGIPENAGVSVGRGMMVPRLGISYRIDSKTVARAGFGISTNPDSFRNVLTTYPSVVSQTITGASSYLPAMNGTQILSLDVGIPAVTTPNLSTGSVALNSIGSPKGTLGANTLPLTYRRGYYETFNVALEREFPGAVTVQATYVGDTIIREVPGININAGQYPGANTVGEPFNTGGGNPLFATQGISAGITSYIPDGTGHYNGLQAQAKRKFANNGSVGTSYTYSRSINDYGDSSDGESSLKVAMTAPAYWRINRAVAGFDRTHNFQAFGNYRLPFGRGQAFLSSGPASYVVDGWELSGSLSRESGTPIDVESNSNSLLGPGSTQFADEVSRSSMYPGGHDSTHPYFNTANFADPSKAEVALDPLGKGCVTWTPGSALTNYCRFGTAGRNSIRGPGFFNSSASLSRTVQITERYSFGLRAEAFNLTNTPSFSNPGNTVTSGGFGIISGTANNNRELRFSGRITF